MNMKKTMLTLGLLASFNSHAEFYPRDFEEVTFRLDETGSINQVFNATRAEIRIGDVTAVRHDIGFYDVNLANVMPYGLDYDEVGVTCSINTPNKSTAPAQNVACYQLSNEPTIRVVSYSNTNFSVDVASTVSVKWWEVDRPPNK